MSGFVDEAQLHVKGGNGGAGAISFRREAHVSKGGPDGGDGGRGGDIWLIASTGLSSLLGFKDHPHRRAQDGVHGSSKQKRGANGPDLEVKVPVGTTVRKLDGSGVADLSAPGDRVLIARGGRGGKGNSRFLSNNRRAPAFAEQAELGEERWLDLELRLVADVALVGFPNAGKSTLVSSVSAAKPKIANYPFTTLEPHLGVVVTGRSGRETEFVIADIPGLVEGAAEGKGLGHQFLRHVERARALLVLLDLSPDAMDPAEQQRILLGELSRYRPELLERPRITVGSKGDVAEGEALDRLAALDRAVPVISAATGQGMTELVGQLATLVTLAREMELEGGADVGRPLSGASAVPNEAAEPGVFVHRPLGETGVEVTRGPDSVWEVSGKSATRAVALSDLTDDDALDIVQTRFKRLGVERALVRAGVRDGDVVRVGELVFTYHPDDWVPEDRAAAQSEATDVRPSRARRLQEAAARAGKPASKGSSHKSSKKSTKTGGKATAKGRAKRRSQ